MANWTERVIDALTTLPGPWDVLPGQFTAPQPVCGEYATARAANDVLTAAGFHPTARFVAAAPLAPGYDMQTLLRYSAGEGLDVIVARRRGPVVTSSISDAE